MTRTDISFIRNLPSTIRVDSNSNWCYKFFHQFDIYEISTFIKLIKDEKIYMIIPQFGGSESLSEPKLYLSEPFLIDNKSNPMLITEFLYEQWNKSCFNQFIIILIY